MDAFAHFKDLIAKTRLKGRYRTFAELERIAGAFPRARWHRSDCTSHDATDICEVG